MKKLTFMPALQRYLKEKKMTMVALEKKAKLPRTTLSSLIGGHRSPGVKTLKSLSKATGLTFEQLLSER